MTHRITAMKALIAADGTIATVLQSELKPLGIKLSIQTLPRCKREDPALAGPPGSSGHLAACHVAFGPAVAGTAGQREKEDLA